MAPSASSPCMLALTGLPSYRYICALLHKYSVYLLFFAFNSRHSQAVNPGLYQLSDCSCRQTVFITTKQTFYSSLPVTSRAGSASSPFFTGRLLYQIIHVVRLRSSLGKPFNSLCPCQVKSILLTRSSSQINRYTYAHSLSLTHTQS